MEPRPPVGVGDTGEEPGDTPAYLRLSKLILSQVIFKALAQDQPPDQRPELLELLCHIAATPAVAVNLSDVAEYRGLIRMLLRKWNPAFYRTLVWSSSTGGRRAGNYSDQSESGSDDDDDHDDDDDEQSSITGSCSGSTESSQLMPMPTLKPQASLPVVFSPHHGFHTTESFYDFDLDAALFADEEKKGIIQYTRGVAWSALPGFTFMTWLRLPTATEINTLLGEVRVRPAGRNLATRPRLIELPQGLDTLAPATPYPVKYVKFCLLHLLSKSRPANFDRSPGLRVSLLRRFDLRTWTIGASCLLLVEADDSSLTAGEAMDRRHSQGGGSVRTLLSLYELGPLNDKRWHHFCLSHANPLAAGGVSSTRGEPVPPAMQVYLDGARLVDNRGSYLVTHLQRLITSLGTERVQRLQQRQQRFARQSEVYPMFTGCQLSKCYVGMHFAGQLQFPSLAAGVVSHHDVFALAEEGPSTFLYESKQLAWSSALAPQLELPAQGSFEGDARSKEQGGGSSSSSSSSSLLASVAVSSSLRSQLPQRNLIYPSPSSPEIHNVPVQIPSLAQTAQQRAGKRGLIQSMSRAVASVGHRLLGDSGSVNPSVVDDGGSSGADPHSSDFGTGVNRATLIFCFDAARTRRAAAGTTTFAEASRHSGRMDDHDRCVQGWTADLQDTGALLSGNVMALTELPTSYSLAPALNPSICGATRIHQPSGVSTGAGSAAGVVSCGAVSGPQAILQCGGFAALLPLMWPVGDQSKVVQEQPPDSGATAENRDSQAHRGRVGTGSSYTEEDAEASRDPLERRRAYLRRFLKLTRLLLQSGAMMRADFLRCGGFEVNFELAQRNKKTNNAKNACAVIISNRRRLCENVID